jgi:hypothetical protein
LASGIALRAAELGFPDLIFFSIDPKILASGIALRAVELGFPDLIFSAADPKIFG